jgi:hypothetical protein
VTIMATPAQDPLAGIQSDVNLLRNQVDALQIAAAERTTPWYKQASTLISVVALAISTVGGGVSYVIQQHKNRILDHAEKLAALQQLTIDIVEVQKQMLDLDFTKDPSKANNLNGMLNNKREIMVSRATELVDDIPTLVPSEILYTLGSQEQLDGHWKRAEQLFLKALSSHPTDVIELNCRRTLATVYMTPGIGVPNGLRKGREQFQLALNLLANHKDETSVSQTGFTYDVWGTMEYLNDQIKDGKEAFNSAQAAYESLSPANLGRQTYLNGLFMHKMSAFRATSAAASVTAQLLGVWRSRDSSPTQITITRGKDGLLQGSLHFPNGTVPANGNVTLEDDNVADLVWTVPFPSFGSLGSSSTFSGKLRLDPGGKSLSFEETLVTVIHSTKLFKAGT